MKNCTSCGAPIKGNSKVCPYCDTVLQDETTDEGTASETKAAGYPMRWHKFMLVYLIIDAVVCFVYGLSAIRGGIILTGSGLADNTFRAPGIVAYSRFVATSLIAMGLFSFIVWLRLKTYFSNGPVFLKIRFVLGIIISIITLCWASSILNTNLFSTSSCLVIISGVVMLIINSSYYTKRSELFVN